MSREDERVDGVERSCESRVLDDLPAGRRDEVRGRPSLGSIRAISGIRSLRRIPGPRRAVAALTDQSLSSLQNYLVLITALRSFGLAQLGTFSLAYTAMPAVITIARGLILEPLTVRFTTADRSSRRNAGRHATGTALALGLLLSLLCIVSSIAIHEPSADRLVVAFGIAVPVMLLQDSWRMYLFATGRAWSAAVNDGLCLVTTGAIIGTVIAHGEVSPAVLILAWAGGTLAGAAFGALQAGFVPKVFSAARWLRVNGSLGLPFALSYLATMGVTVVAYGLIGLIVSISAVGLLGGAVAIMAPVTTMTAAVGLFLLPESARWKKESPQRLLGGTAMVTVALPVIVLGCAGVLAILPPAITHILAGSHWRVAKTLLLPVSLWVAGSAARQPAACALRVLGKGGTILALSVITGLGIVVAALIGGIVAGASGAAWGFAVSQCASLAMWWVITASAVRRLEHELET
jgi:O-antigen/teichoic acid export membrane protein